MHQRTTVVLLSGGIDSLLAALLAERNDGPITTLSVNYGQHVAELEAAVQLAQRYKWQHARANVTPFPESLDPAATNIIPGRNAMFLSLAVAMLPPTGGRIYVGATQDDFKDYPDCRPDFFTAYEVMAIKQGINLVIKRPLIDLTKAEIVTQLRKRGAPIELTVSCYRGVPACGECNACTQRQRAMNPGGNHGVTAVGQG